MTKYAEDGYVIQVGDLIEDRIGDWDAPNPLFSRRYRVTRVTKTLALCRVTDTANAKYPRIYGFSFGSKPYYRSNLQSRVIPHQETNKELK